ncbi:hypothetical protein [Paenibacillus radicis (ex Gao et al. 2016)]|uniref:YhfM-like domain-containing protein n=1 Tax=Paenibacillus radicis (ex Gao et al. 2016) TaxID=1737354 RepID=A0A917M2V3_9BACL|nr:hypothetical protein [Paenibacillus radicis (ex Gao et al. 2016)]GGG75766.1 hypothetical protein GCM10010918_35170 [Paenibacillus radicis (ex Gao et al. 2016)]
MKKGLLISLIVIIAAAIVIGIQSFRISVNEVVLERLDGLTDTERGVEEQWTLQDRKTIKAFAYAERFASKNKGDYDIASPPYQFKLGGEPYLLWIYPSTSLALIQKPGESAATYTLSRSSSAKLKRIIEKQDGHFGEKPSSANSG